MAEVGKGDARWIVQDREDGANCNNWHWTEKNILPWAKGEVHEALSNKTVLTTPKLELKTLEVANLEGDCIVMNRKKKLISSFDIKFDLPWEGIVKDEDTGDTIYTVKGKFVIPDVDDTTIGDDMQVDITCAETGDAANMIVVVCRKEGRQFIRKGMEEFAAKLKDSHNISNKMQSTVSEAKTSSPKKAAEDTRGCVDEFTLRMDWRCPPAELWDALSNPGKASAYTRSQVTLELKEGGAFSYLGGSISGTFASVDAPKGFVMNWRLDNWDAGHFSKVELTLDSQEAGATELKIKHSNIPYVCLLYCYLNKK